jgi:hypothetical protein
MTAFLQGLFTLLTGPLGIAVIGILLIWGIFETIMHRRAGPVMWAIIGGGAFYAVAWIVANVLQAAGGA